MGYYAAPADSVEKLKAPRIARRSMRRCCRCGGGRPPALLALRIKRPKMGRSRRGLVTRNLRQCLNGVGIFALCDFGRTDHQRTFRRRLQSALADGAPCRCLRLGIAPVAPVIFGEFDVLFAAPAL